MSGEGIAEAGSSPRGRGKHTRDAVGGLFGRLIPARAGKTTSPATSGQRLRAHPRAGGENAVTINGELVSLGSSPRGRGKLIGISPFIFCVGLIPARAGKTQSPDRAVTRCWAHPRAGGENALPRMSAGAYPGSSPRGRGKHERRGDVVCEAGLIPARAGKTRGSIGRTRRHSAHPRAGGENCYFKTGGRMGIGSSPRGRGKHHGAGARDEARGLIPARAGKTSRCTCCICCTVAHPRAGGENVALCLYILALCWLIPARAGKTTDRQSLASCPRAHPRAGGENVGTLTARAVNGGSSPRGRGKQTWLALPVRARRLIPARAGKTAYERRCYLRPKAHPRAGGENGEGGHPRLAGVGSSPRGRGKRCR